MSRDGWSRRSMLGALSAGTALGAVPALASASAAVAAAEPIRFANALETLRALVRVQGDASGADAPWWYTGSIYGVRQGEKPLPLVRFEGCEINRFTPRADGSFVLTARTTSFFRDIESGEFLRRMRNPYTGREVEVRTNVLSGLGHVVFSEAGVTPKWKNIPDAPTTPLEVSWTAHGPWAWMRFDRVYPPGLPQPLGEASSMLVERARLLDASLASVPAHFSSSYIAPWPLWLGMEGQAGHVVWHADGLKLRSVEELPAEFRDRLRREHPAQLSAPAIA